MEENKELLEMMTKLEQAAGKQTRYARLQCLFTFLAALFCAGVFVAVVTLLPMLNTAIGQATTVLNDVEQVSQQLAAADWEGVISNLEQVSGQLGAADWTEVVSNLEQTSQKLAQADLAGLVEEVDQLVKTSQTGIEDTLKKLDAIDLVTLNKAITDLGAVVAPLAKLLGK